MKRKVSPTKLRSSELAKTARLLARVTPVPFMEGAIFRTIWRARLVPMVTMEPLIFERNPFAPSIKTLPRVLLSYRKDKHYDAWHVPGGFLGANENHAQAIRRILRRELGVLPRTIQRLFTLNHPNARRDHHVSIFFAVTLAKNPRLRKGALEYFDLSRLPPKLIRYYKPAFAFLKKVHSFSKSLPPHERWKLLKCLDICEVAGRQ